MNKSRSGFTLMEVLVALVILSVMTAGFARYASQQAQRAAYLTDKTLASVVAANAIAEVQLAGNWPELGATTQRVTMADRTWQVAVDVQNTSVPDLRRLEASVSLLAPGRAAPQEKLLTLTGFVGKH